MPPSIPSAGIRGSSAPAWARFIPLGVLPQFPYLSLEGFALVGSHTPHWAGRGEDFPALAEPPPALSAGAGRAPAPPFNVCAGGLRPAAPPGTAGIPSAPTPALGTPVVGTDPSDTPRAASGVSHAAGTTSTGGVPVPSLVPVVSRRQPWGGGRAGGQREVP